MYKHNTIHMVTSYILCNKIRAVSQISLCKLGFLCLLPLSVLF